MSLHHITKREKIIVMLAVMSGLFLVALDQTIISTALGQIVQDFNSFSSLGFVITAYLLTSTVTTPLAGKLSDMYGRRPMLLTGVAVFTIGSLLSGLAPSIEWLIAWRALQGIGGGFITANAFTIVGDLFTPRERGKWQGLIGAVFGISSAIGPLLGGWLTDGHQVFMLTTDWRWTFYINVPVGIVAAAVIARFCPPIKHDSDHAPDYAGAALLTVALASTVLAVDNTEMVFAGLIENGWSLGFIKATLWTIAAVAGGLFIAVERSAKQPIIPLRFFQVKTYRIMMMTTLLFGAAFLGSILYLTQFNQQVYGASPSEAGLMLLPMMAGMMIASIGGGQIISRTGHYKRYVLFGLALAAISMLSLVTLQPDTPYIQEGVIMFFLGLGMGLVNPILSLAVQNEFEQKDLGAATSSIQLSRGLGSTVGTAILSGMLTAGIMSGMGNPEELPYIQSLKQAPESAQIVRGEITADTLLQVNTRRDEIAEGYDAATVTLPAPQRDRLRTSFKEKQDSYGVGLIDSFTRSLHGIFMTSAALMALALLIVSFVQEKKLRGDVKATPGE